ncbi:MAG: IS110 family transposase [Firmicutes bacterium]|nr:IS110 family transposase [Bacillota bacterium]
MLWAGEITAVWVPSEEDEALRDLVQAREFAKRDLRRARQRVSSLLLRLESEIHASAIDGPHSPVIQALQALKGVAEITAVTVVAEVGQFSRFDHPEAFIGYSRLVPREHSSGSSRWRRGITKTGNNHIRFVLGEEAWAYRNKPATKMPLRAHQKGLNPEVLRIALKAQQRLHRTYCRLINRGKPTSVAATAVARELLDFMWAIGCYVEADRQNESVA